MSYLNLSSISALYKGIEKLCSKSQTYVGGGGGFSSGDSGGFRFKTHSEEKT